MYTDWSIDPYEMEFDYVCVRVEGVVIWTFDEVVTVMIGTIVVVVVLSVEVEEGRLKSLLFS